MPSIISGSSSRVLAFQLCNELKITPVNASIDKFEDEELRIQIQNSLFEKDVFIIQSTSKPANDHLMELLLLADAAKRSGAKRIIAVIPYFGYSRQDRPSYNFGPISARLVASLIETAGINQIITVELHSSQTEGFFKVGVQNISTTNLFSNLLKCRKNLVVVSPDIGGLTRAKKLSQELGVDLAVINKTRTTHNDCFMQEIIGNIEEKHCVIIDDIIDTAGTICKASELLMQKGAHCVEVFATHAVLSKNAVEKINESPIEKVTVTNSIEQKNLSDKFEVVSINNLLLEALKNILPVDRIEKIF